MRNIGSALVHIEKPYHLYATFCIFYLLLSDIDVPNAIVDRA